MKSIYTLSSLLSPFILVITFREAANVLVINTMREGFVGVSIQDWDGERAELAGGDGPARCILRLLKVMRLQDLEVLFAAGDLVSGL